MASLEADRRRWRAARATEGVGRKRAQDVGQGNNGGYGGSKRGT